MPDAVAILVCANAEKAVAAKQFLIDDGYDEGKITMEPVSRVSYDSIKFCKPAPDGKRDIKEPAVIVTGRR